MHALLNTLLGLRILRGAFMRLVTFETPAKQSRIGAMTTDDRVVDLHSACALYLRDVENESAFYRLAEALVPPEMRALFEGGDTSLEAARKAFDHVLQNDAAAGPRGVPDEDRGFSASRRCNGMHGRYRRWRRLR